VRDIIHEFNERELVALKASSSRHRARRFREGRRDLEPNLAFTARLREETDLNALTPALFTGVRGRFPKVALSSQPSIQ
jgi:hypothetical protein